MRISRRSEKLEQAFAALSANYRGTDIDLHAVCRERRVNAPVTTGDFMSSIGVPTHAGASHGNQTFTLFKYDDVKNVLQDAATFTNGFIAKGFGSFFSADGLIILAMDGDPHRAARCLLQPVFAPNAVLPWRSSIEHQIRDEFILSLVPDKQADLLDFGLYFPIRVIYGLIGFPDDELGNFYDYAAMGLSIPAGPQLDSIKEAESRERAMKATNALYEVVMALVKRRRAEGASGDDLVCRLLRAEFEGRKLDDHEIATFVRSMVAAGGETTTRTFSSIMTLLMQRPKLVERIRNDRSLVPRLIDESARFEPVSTVKVRQAARDVEIRGAHVHWPVRGEDGTVDRNRRRARPFPRHSAGSSFPASRYRRQHAARCGLGAGDMGLTIHRREFVDPALASVDAQASGPPAVLDSLDAWSNSGGNALTARREILIDQSVIGIPTP